MAELAETEKPTALLIPEQQTPGHALERIGAMIANGSIDATTLERLTALYERAEDRYAKKCYMAAMARLQEKLPPIPKSGENTHLHTKYAKLEDLHVTIAPLLADEGFSFSFGSHSADGKLFTVTATLSHAEGHSEQFSLMVPIDTGPGRSPVQAVVSTHSYARRGLITMSLNLVARGDDNDGESAKPITEGQLLDLTVALTDVGTDMGRFFKHFEIEKLDQLPAGRLKEAYNGIDVKRRKAAKR